MKSDKEIQEFNDIIYDIRQNPTVLLLKNHIQHMNSTRYKHCYDVAYYTYKICRKLGLDYTSAARGAMLHDFYLHDWIGSKDKEKSRFHLFRHPKIALKNAKQIFKLNNKEQDIILKHMWPITIKPPRFSESYIVSFVDKYCATKEFFEYLRYKKSVRIFAKQKFTRPYNKQ